MQPHELSVGRRYDAIERQIFKRDETVGELRSMSSARRKLTILPSLSSGRVCDIPTYDGSGECTHPSVVDSVAVLGQPWQGYRYWLAFTPYPGNDDRRSRFENPSIVASHNGQDWVVPTGVRAPLISPPGLSDLGRSVAPGLPLRRLIAFVWGIMIGISFNADPALYLSRRGTMYLAYVHSLKGGSHDELLVVASADGWRSLGCPRTLVRTHREIATYEVNVPSVVERDGEKVELYYGYVPRDPDGRPRFDQVGIRRRSGTSLNALGPATSLKLVGPAGRRLWHREVRRYLDGRVVCFGTFTPDIGSRHEMTWPPRLSLYAGEIRDDTLTFDDSPILEASLEGWDSQCIYKPSGLIERQAEGRTLRLWYSAQDARSHQWRIGTSTVEIS